jgi:hypothetical protein
MIMLIEHLARFNGYGQGSVREVPDADAKKWIKMGIATEMTKEETDGETPDEETKGADAGASDTGNEASGKKRNKKASS